MNTRTKSHSVNRPGTEFVLRIHAGSPKEGAHGAQSVDTARNPTLPKRQVAISKQRDLMKTSRIPTLPDIKQRLVTVDNQMGTVLFRVDCGRGSLPGRDTKVGRS
jgi:hypothetical protein